MENELKVYIEFVAVINWIYLGVRLFYNYIRNLDKKKVENGKWLQTVCTVDSVELQRQQIWLYHKFKTKAKFVVLFFYKTLSHLTIRRASHFSYSDDDGTKTPKESIIAPWTVTDCSESIFCRQTTHVDALVRRFGTRWMTRWQIWSPATKHLLRWRWCTPV
jgi:hypothetical protein